MKKVYLYAYTQTNLGDDLFIRAITHRYQDVQFYIEADDGKSEYLSSIKNLKTINPNSLFANTLKKIRKSLYARYIFEIQKKCDVLVYIGGSIFIEYPSWKSYYNWWDYITKKFDFIVIGANFGPYETEEYLNEMRTAIGNMKDICFRDRYSYQLFNGLSNVRYAPDLVFSLPLELKQSQKKVFISVIDCTYSRRENISQFDNLYLNKIIEVINGFCKEGYEIVVAGFCQNENDNRTTQIIVRNVDDKELVKELVYDGNNLSLVLDEIATSCYVIGTRFHSLVLGMGFKKPVFPIIYSKKTDYMLNDLGFQGETITIENISELNYETIKKNLNNNYCINIDNIIKESERHYLKLDETLL